MTSAVRRWLLASVVAALLGASGCSSDAPIPVAPGIFAPLGEVMPRASESQRSYFALGQEVATRAVSISQGLGPTFNATQCVACHERPVFGGSAGHTRDHQLVAFRDSDGSYVPRGSHGTGVQAHYLTGPSGRVADDPSRTCRPCATPSPSSVWARSPR